MNEPHRERVRIAGIGDELTVFDALELMRRTGALLDAIGTELNGPGVVSWKAVGITMFDGKERPETREYAATCSDACRERVPAFAGIPCPLTYHCRDCLRLVCWRHAGLTDMTGGWCEACAT